MPIEINGFCEPRFRPLQDAFVANFEEGLEAGASLAMTHRGRMVVDLWAGTRDANGKEPWERDTISHLFSITKILVVISILKLIDEGMLELDAPVAGYWPEFGRADKSDVTVRQVLLHQAGVPGFEPPQPFEALLNWERITAAIADQPRWFESGVSCYHPLTFGIILGELARRVTGMMVSDFFETHFAKPLGVDLHMGLKDEADLARVAMPVMMSSTGGILHEPGSVSERVFESLKADLDIFSVAHLRAESPSSNGLGNARSLARAGAVLALDGELDGRRYLSKSIVHLATTEQSHADDLIVGPLRLGLGLGLHSTAFPAPRPTTFHWGGLGGSWHVMDRSSQVSCAYTMNGYVFPDFDSEELIDLRQKRCWDALAEIMKALEDEGLPHD